MNTVVDENRHARNPSNTRPDIFAGPGLMGLGFGSKIEDRVCPLNQLIGKGR